MIFGDLVSPRYGYASGRDSRRDRSPRATIGTCLFVRDAFRRRGRHTALRSADVVAMEGDHAHLQDNGAHVREPGLWGRCLPGTGLVAPSLGAAERSRLREEVRKGSGIDSQTPSRGAWLLTPSLEWRPNRLRRRNIPETISVLWF